MESKIIPLPGYGLTTIDTEITDKEYDTPQTGTLLRLTKEDSEKVFDKIDGTTYGDLIGKKIHWAKYSDADGTFYDDDINSKIVLISLEKLRGYKK
jgi:hypothetical protein